MQTNTIIAIIYWLLLAALVIPSYVFAIQKLFGHPQKLADFKRWGYSATFMRLLGLGEMLALTAMLFKPTRYAGFICFCVILAGAVCTHLKNRDDKKQLMTPVIVWAHMAVIFTLTFFVK